MRPCVHERALAREHPSRSGHALAEDRGADADVRRAFFDRDLEVRAHAHRERRARVEVSITQRAQRREVWAHALHVVVVRKPRVVMQMSGAIRMAATDSQ